jgi:DNA-binding transcriptional ArsR family regulator
MVEHVFNYKHMEEVKLDQIKKNLLGNDTVRALADTFKILGDSTRIKILSCLELSPLCVTDISEVIGMSKSAVSHQLRLLKQMKLIKFEKSGREAIYSLDDEHVSKIFQCALEHVNE